jgi:hypothetical protein
MQNAYIQINPNSQQIPNSQFAELMRAVLGKGKLFRFQASGFSMFPFICHGDIVTISPVISKISSGKIIAIFNEQNHLLIHRIIEITSEKVLTKGDNSDEIDGWVTQNEILGVVVKVEHQSKDTRLGFGPERRAIAWFSKHCILRPFLSGVFFIRHLLITKVCI